MKKKVVSLVLVLVASVVGLVGTVSASGYLYNPGCCYEDVQPFDLGNNHAD